MFGIRRKFTCKKCLKEQTHEIGITPLFKINEEGSKYAPLNCCECNKLHYVSTFGSADVISEDEVVTIERAGTACF